MKKGIHGFISGRVQGVFFRASTRGKAKTLGLTGWVRNLPDGRVEVMAFGEENTVSTLHAWLHQGPSGANVTKVEVEEVEWQDLDGFN